MSRILSIIEIRDRRVARIIQEHKKNIEAAHIRFNMTLNEINDKRDKAIEIAYDAYQLDIRSEESEVSTY